MLPAAAAAAACPASLSALCRLPAASVSGLYLANACARYFSLGKVGKDQILDYAARKGMQVSVACDAHYVACDMCGRWRTWNAGWDRIYRTSSAHASSSVQPAAA